MTVNSGDYIRTLEQNERVSHDDDHMQLCKYMYEIESLLLFDRHTHISDPISATYVSNTLIDLATDQNTISK